MGSPVLFQGSFVKLLKSALNLNDQAYILTGTVDPSASATSAPQGSLYLRTGSSGSQLFIKQDGGSTTNWRDISATSTQRITQAAHGFLTGQWVGFSGGSYIAATNRNVSYAIGVVTTVIDSSNFIITRAGFISGLSGLTSGSLHYLTAGGAISSSLDRIGVSGTLYQQQAFYAVSTTSGYVTIGPVIYDADGNSNRDGFVTTVAQSLIGIKTFLSKLTANVGVEVPNTIVSSGTEVVSSGTTRIVGRLIVNSPATVQVDGDLQITGALTGTGSITGSGTTTNV